MSETTNYGLYLEDNDQTKFKDWREKINGINESNMVIIDRVLGEKANASTTVDGILTVDGWTDVDGRMTQALSVPGLGATQNGNIALSPTATPDERSTARAAILALAGQTEGELTVVADGQKPTINIPVVVTLIW